MNIFKRLYAWMRASPLTFIPPSPLTQYVPDYEKLCSQFVEIFNKHKYKINIIMKDGKKEDWAWDCPSKRDRVWNTLFNNDRSIRVNGVEGFATFEHGTKTVAIARDQILYGEKKEIDPITAEQYYYYVNPFRPYTRGYPFNGINRAE